MGGFNIPLIQKKDSLLPSQQLSAIQGYSNLRDQGAINQQEMQMNQQKISAWDQDQQKQAAIKGAIEKAGSAEAAIPDIEKIDPKLAMEYREGFSKWRKSTDDEKISHLELLQKQSERVAQLVAAVRPGDMQGWLSAVDTAHKDKLIDDDKYQVYASMPPDPGVLQSIQQEAMTAPQRIAAEKDRLAAERQKKLDAQAQEKFEAEKATNFQTPSADEKDFKAAYKRYYDQMRAEKKDPKTEYYYRQQYDKEQAENRRAGTAVGAETNMPVSLGDADPESSTILQQTGLSLPAFKVLTGTTTELPRDVATRTRANKEAEAFSRARKVDTSTIVSQYKSFNKILASNQERLNQTQIMEQELAGTVDNLKKVAKDSDLSDLNFANVVKVWTGGQVNDPMAQQYAMHLSQLRNELSAYYAATQGRNGANITVDDKHEADNVIKNGISTGSLQGLEDAIHNSTGKMATVMNRSVDTARKGIWDLFGVGKNYKPSAGATTPTSTQRPTPANRRPLNEILGLP